MKNLYNALQLKQLYQLKSLGYRYTSAKPFVYEEKNPLELPNTLDKVEIQAQNCYLSSLDIKENDISMEIEDKESSVFLGRSLHYKFHYK